ncbi:MAG: copper resistance protein CopC [Actinomycetota bacterium]
MSLLAFSVYVPDAAAHAELRQSSPLPGSVVGGEFHSIALQFSGLDTEAPFRAELLDPSGTPIGNPAVREEMRIVIPIEPLEVPGTYTVSYTTTGVDGDLVSDLFTFRFDPSAPEPVGITIEITTTERVGWFGYLLILVGAAILGYLVHRVRFALREHRAAQAAS